MPGKRVRTEDVNFLGQKYRTFKCNKCNKKYEDMGLDNSKICPICDNPQDEYKCMCWSCQAGRAMLESEK